MNEQSCTKCGNPEPVVELKYANAVLCKTCFNDFYESRVKRVTRENKMFSHNDKVLVGVSGGKDSMALLHVLNKLGHPITAVTINEGITGYRDQTTNKVKEYCSTNNIHHVEMSFEKTYSITMDKAHERFSEKPACSHCGVLRRDSLNKADAEINANKIITGHNLDDECQTIVMNFFRGEIERMTRAPNKKTELPRVKPLRETSEKENTLYCLLNEIPYSDIECPYAREAYRNKIRSFLNQLERDHPGTKLSILHANDKLSELLVNKNMRGAANYCLECGALTSVKNKVCKTWQTIKELA